METTSKLREALTSYQESLEYGETATDPILKMALGRLRRAINALEDEQGLDREWREIRRSALTPETWREAHSNSN